MRTVPLLRAGTVPCCITHASGIFPRRRPGRPLPESPMRIETLAVHAGHAVDPTTGAITPPIHLSSTFERDPDGGYRSGHVYARTSNPNRAAVEEVLAQLDVIAADISF